MLARTVNENHRSQRSYESHKNIIPKCCFTSEKLRDAIDKMVYQAAQDFSVELMDQLAVFKPES